MDFDICAGRLVNIWKENMLENLKTEELEFASARNFLAELKRDFGRRDNELAKVAKFKK